MNHNPKSLLPPKRSTNKVLAGADKQRQVSPRGPGRPFKSGNVYAWKHGQSGNYAGRPKGKTLSETIRKKLAEISDVDNKRTWAEVIAERLMRVAAGLSSENSTNAAREIGNRTEGKPAQQIMTPKAAAEQVLAIAI